MSSYKITIWKLNDKYNNNSILDQHIALEC